MWYNYDGLGKRRNKLFADPDDLHWYRWAGWSVLSEYDTTGASGWEIPAAAARVDVAGLAERGAGAAYAYRLHDHLGSVRGLRGASKAPLARYAYAPYGELNHGAGRPLHRGFTGHHWDAESAMYYAPFRYYMPGAGRWLSRDPLGFIDGPNVYGYVRNNPSRHGDPLGLQVLECAAGGGVIGGPFGAAAGAFVGIGIFLIGVAVAVDVLQPSIPIPSLRDDDPVDGWPIPKPIGAPPVGTPTIGIPWYPPGIHRDPNFGDKCSSAIKGFLSNPAADTFTLALIHCTAAVLEGILRIFGKGGPPPGIGDC